MKGIVSTPDSLTSTKTRRVYPFVFIANDVELQKKADILFKQSLEQVNHRVLHENNLECIKNNEFTKEELSHWIDGIPYQMQAGVEFDHSQFKDMVNSMLDDINRGQENEVYFYHSDHLGSGSWITDANGDPVQHLQYLPYGEPFVNHRISSYNERFTFTGKETDCETGFSYFGARYYDPTLLTSWTAVDPMSDKYPNISPYAYCNWNPIRLIDPNGCETDEWNFNLQTGECVWVSDRGRSSGTDYINIVDADGGYHGTYVGSRSNNYSFSAYSSTDCNGDFSYSFDNQNMVFTLCYPGMGDNSSSEVTPSGQFLPTTDQLGNVKTAAFAVDAFTASQNALIENGAAAGKNNVSKKLGKAVARYNTGIKGLGIGGVVATCGASIAQGVNYYSNGGTNPFISVKLTTDFVMAVVSNFGWGAAIGFGYSLLDVCTDGFGTNRELNKFQK